MKRVKDRTSKRLRCQLNSNSNYIRFDWVEFMSTEYFRVIDAINDCYKKMLEIGKCAEVFRPVGGRRPDILTAKSKKEFMKEKWFQLPLSGYVQRVGFYAFLIHSSTLSEVVFCTTSAYLSHCTRGYARGLSPSVMLSSFAIVFG